MRRKSEPLRGPRSRPAVRWLDSLRKRDVGDPRKGDKVSRANRACREGHRNRGGHVQPDRCSRTTQARPPEGQRETAEQEAGRHHRPAVLRRPYLCVGAFSSPTSANARHVPAPIRRRGVGQAERAERVGHHEAPGRITKAKREEAHTVDSPVEEAKTMNGYRTRRHQICQTRGEFGTPHVANVGARARRNPGRDASPIAEDGLLPQAGGAA